MDGKDSLITTLSDKEAHDIEDVRHLIEDETARAKSAENANAVRIEEVNEKINEGSTETLGQAKAYTDSVVLAEENARKALLQITSSYGSVTKKGVVNFTATIADYRAPVVDKALKRHSLKKTAAPKAKKIIRIAVSPSDYDRILALLKQTSDIEVL